MEIGPCISREDHNLKFRSGFPSSWNGGQLCSWFIHRVLMTASIKLDYRQSLKRSNWRLFIQLHDTANIWPQRPCGEKIQFTLGR